MQKNPSYIPWNPVLKLEVSPQDEEEYELEKSDIIDVFKRYGKVQNVEISSGKALIHFAD